MKHILTIIASSIILLSPLSMFGQEQKFFYPISVESGMPHSEVTAIVEDRWGYIWFGTYNGLARYNGGSLMNITRDAENDRFKSLRITSLYCDEDNSFLYIGTEDDGLKIMDLNTYAICERLYFANSIYSINKGISDDLWIGTERGIVRLTFKDGDFQYRYCESSLSKVSDIIQMDENTLLAASGPGVFMIDIGSGHLKLIRRGFARSLFDMGNGHFLLGTSTGLYECDPNFPESIRKISDIDVFAIYRSLDGRWWIGSIDSGLYRFTSDFSSLTCFREGKKEGLPDNGIRAFMEDFSGNLWIGTQNGACKYYTQAEIFDFYAETMDDAQETHTSNKTSSFHEDSEGRLWIGKYHSGLKILDRKTSKIHSFSKDQIPALYGATISCFYSDNEENLWIGTWGGLYILNHRWVSAATGMRTVPLTDFADRHRLKGKTFFKITCDKDGHFFFSTDNGLYRYIPSPSPSGKDNFGGTLTNWLPGVTTTDFHIEYSQENEKIIWVGTRNGLNKLILDKNGSLVETIQVKGTENEAVPEGFISVVSTDSKDRLWILGLDGYICLVEKGRKDREEPSFRILDFNPDGDYNTAESLQEDNSGNLWIGGVRMMKFNPQTWTCEIFDESDGLQNRSFKIWSSAKLSTGELVFGGINGFTIFNPDRLQKNSIAPKLVLEDLYISGKKINVGQKITRKEVMTQRLDLHSRLTLPHHCNDISISFSALHYTSPFKNRHRYILEGFDSKYQEVSGETRSASYRNLSPGTYTFRFDGSNSDGVWAETARTLKIKIRPPLLLTPLAIIFYILAAVIIIYFIFKSLIIREQNKERTRLYELKLKNFADISHEIKTPLSLISAPIEEIYENADLDPKAYKKLTLVRKNIARLMDLVEQIIDFNRFENDIMSLQLSNQDLIDICRTCMSYFEDKAERNDITFNFETNAVQIPVLIDRGRIEKVLFNIIGNAFKFTPAGGSIVVRCRLRDEDVIVSITDTGSGIDPEMLPHVFERFISGDRKSGSGIGLALAKAIVEQHSGKIWVESEKNRRTTFYFTLLLSEKHFLDNPSSFKVAFGQENNTSPYLYNGSFSTKNEKPSVLIAEDDSDLREYLKDTLGQHFSVSLCSNGVEAFEMALSNDFSCIVSDIAMPMMDGVEFCKKAKKDIRLSHTPIILLTAKDSVEDKISGFDAGADDYVTKPFDLKLLIARINNIIKQRQELKAKFHNHINVAPSMVTISSIDEQFMDKCLSLIEENISDSDYNVENLCKDLSMSRPTVYKKIKSLTGLSVVAFIRSIRMKRAAQILLQDGSSIKNVMYMVGFDNSSYFSAQFRNEFGCTPKEYVEQHKKEGD